MTVASLRAASASAAPPRTVSARTAPASERGRGARERHGRARRAETATGQAQDSSPSRGTPTSGSRAGSGLAAPLPSARAVGSPPSPQADRRGCSPVTRWRAAVPGGRARARHRPAQAAYARALYGHARHAPSADGATWRRCSARSQAGTAARARFPSPSAAGSTVRRQSARGLDSAGSQRSARQESGERSPSVPPQQE